MSIICPTVTCQTEDLHEYRRQMERVENLSKRLQIDLMDGEFAPTKSPDVDKIWWPEDTIADVHLMFRNPADVLNDILELKPSLVIIHAEADVDVGTFAGAVKGADIRFGLAFLQGSEPKDFIEELSYADHVLIFSGDLGHFGGSADLSLLRKVQQIKNFNSNIEIGWDGGVNADNIRQLAEGGVDVLNVGGFIQNADDPVKAYNQLAHLLS